MRRIFVVALILIFAASVVSAQIDNNSGGETVCQLSVSKAPAVRGLRLGMSIDELLSLFPGSSDNPEVRADLDRAKRAPSYGAAHLLLDPSKYPEARQFSGIGHVRVNLFDDRVISFRIDYKGSEQLNPWSHVDQVIEKVASAYSLPGPEAWSRPNATDRKMLQCAGFTVTVSIGSGCCPVLGLETPYPRQQIEARGRADQKKARDAFTP